MPVKSERIRILKDLPLSSGPVVYWMSRDQRSRDNWALLHAQELALKQKSSLVVLFCLVPRFLNATARHYGFMLRGLQEVEKSLAAKNIPFFLLRGDPKTAIPSCAKKISAGAVVSDFNPLRIKTGWTDAVVRNIAVPFHEVDAHNIVPCWTASDRQEYAAYTIRPKIRRLLPQFLHEFPPLKKHPVPLKGRAPDNDWKGALSFPDVDHTVSEVDWITPGEKAARRAMKTFMAKRLAGYDERRNDPLAEGQSNLSPYLHFGQLSAQRLALEVRGSSAPGKDRQAFLEELIVRRELSDNFCFYNTRYDSSEAFPEWAKKTLGEHGKDRREYLYSQKEFEEAKTHDDLWNAAQREMVVTGKMHGYMRMYWAKKILEWSRSPESALRTAIYLNDRYELDGRDPNGYAGAAWSIGGVHDRAWNERPVFGKVRYMSYGGCKGKFDVSAYIRKWTVGKS